MTETETGGASGAAENTYDLVDYPSAVFYQTHPGRLAAVARMHGIEAPAVATARVLEIGGGDGLNLIALGTAYPDARFLSFDLSAQAVRRGKGIVKDLGLDHVMVELGDVVEVARDLTQEFDYIICHGVYAWVPAPVREAIMQLIGKVLAPAGVAYISFNALPGGYLRQALRDMLRREVAGITDTKERVSRAHAALDDYIKRTGDTPAQAALRSEAKLMREKNASVLFHDELSDCFEPQAISDVCAAAAAHGLQFLGDAGEGPRGDGFLPDDATDLSLAAVVREAQGFDDRAVRFFRQILFVRDDLKPTRTLDAENFKSLLASCEGQKTGEHTFRSYTGEIAVTDPRLSAIVSHLNDIFPKRIAVGDLTDDPDVILNIHKLFEQNLIGLNTEPESFALTIADRPKLSPLVRVLIDRGHFFVPRLDHRMLDVREEGPRQFMAMLDGETPLDELRARWAQGTYAEGLEFDDILDMTRRFTLLMA